MPTSSPLSPIDRFERMAQRHRKRLGRRVWASIAGQVLFGWIYFSDVEDYLTRSEWADMLAVALWASCALATVYCWLGLADWHHDYPMAEADVHGGRDVDDPDFLSVHAAVVGGTGRRSA